MAILAALALAGCAGFPSHEAPPPLARVDHSATTRTFTAPTTSWPVDHWWSVYGDAQLDALISKALADSPTIAIARARLDRARAAARITGAATMPEVHLDASITAQKQSYNYLSPAAFTPRTWKDYGRATLDFSWDLDLWGRNRAALAAATSDAEAAAADAAEARLVLSTAIASAYAELARLHEARDTASAALDVRAKTVELFESRRANGLETLGSVRQVESRRASAAADVLTLDERIALQRNAIAQLVGDGPDRALDIERPSVDIQRAFGLPENLPANLLGRRPDIVAARLRAEAAGKRVDEARAAFYPDINLAAFIGVMSLGLGQLATGGSLIGSVGPALSLPIFDAGRLDGQLDAARADYAETAASYEGTLVQALREVSDAATSQRALGGEVARMSEAVETARDAVHIQKNRYEGGLGTYLDVLAAEDALLATTQSLADLQARSFTLDVALVRALGGGYTNNVN
jgi:NodT family efflux transporter outer membrane factor (OMF) lipoprotein